MTSIQEALSASGYVSSTLSMVEVSNQLVNVVNALIANVHDDADYCSSCGQNYYSTVGKTCCYECGSSCNLQDGCCSNDCEVSDHEITCPVCMDAPVAKGKRACKGCLCDLYPDDPRSIHYAAGLPIGHSDEWKQWVDFGDDDAPNARVKPSDIPF